MSIQEMSSRVSTASHLLRKKIQGYSIFLLHIFPLTQGKAGLLRSTSIYISSTLNVLIHLWVAAFRAVSYISSTVITANIYCWTHYVYLIGTFHASHLILQLFEATTGINLFYRWGNCDFGYS